MTRRYMLYLLPFRITGMLLAQSGLARQVSMSMLKNLHVIIFLKEGKMIEASRKYNVRVQTGFQNRSINSVMEAMKFLHDGGIGDCLYGQGNVL